jgi:multidrug resistance efflux pump
MILFLTLLYVGALFALLKLGVIKPNLFWKLSPLLWMFALLVVLFIPMQWGAPSGAARVYQGVVEIIPNVSGEVIEISAKPNVPIAAGDPIFKIDPKPFQYVVDAKKAALAEAEQAVPQLKEAMLAAEAGVDEAKAARDQAKQEYERYATANKSKTQPFSELDVENRRLRFVASESGVERAEATMRQAGLAYQSEIDGVNTTVARLRSELASAEYNLAETVVKAPSDGFIVGLSLRVGQRVANIPLRSWVAYVNTGAFRLSVGISQRRLRYVKPGQEAEVVFNLYPGKTFKATVEQLVEITPSGQLQASGLVPAAPSAQQPAEPFSAILTLKDARLNQKQLYGGNVGTAAIYTDQMAATHLIRRVMVRMEAWMNYILP